MSTDTTPTICHQCQTPISGDPVRTTAGEPAHSDCLESAGDITPGDVEGVREDLLDKAPEDPEAREAWIDAVIEFDRRLTDHGL